MAEIPYNQGIQVKPRSDSEVSGALMRGYGDITEYRVYTPIFEDAEFLNIAVNENGEFLKNDEGAYLTTGEVYKHKFLKEVKVESRSLPIDNFFSIGLTTSMMKDERQSQAHELLSEVADQIELLILDLEGDNPQGVLEKTAYLKKIYVLLGLLTDVSKSSGELAYLAKTEIGVNRTDFLQRQEILEEQKRKGPGAKLMTMLSHKGSQKKTLQNWGR